MKKPALGHFGGCSVHPSGSNRHSARRMKLLYFFLLRRNPKGLPLQKMTPPRTDQMSAGADSGIQNSSIRCLGISDIKSPSCAANGGEIDNASKPAAEISRRRRSAFMGDLRPH